MHLTSLRTRHGRMSLIRRPQPGPGSYRAAPPFWKHALSRRQFLLTSTAAAGLALGSGLWSPALAKGSTEPNPIPGGLDFLGDGSIFHVFAPGFAGLPTTDDPSVITDFNGHVGLAYTQGMGTETNLATGEVVRRPFDTDIRFMKGEYIGSDGKHHNGAFVLV